MQLLLLARFDSNELHRFVAAFPPQEIEAWHAAFSIAPPAPHKTDTLPTDSIFEAVTAAILTCAVPPGTGRAASLRARLISATMVSAKSRVPLDDPRIWRALDHLLPIEETPSGGAEAIVFPEPAEQMAASANVSSSPALPLPLSPPAFARDSPPANPFWPSDEWTAQIHNALPFLLLGVLARIGYIASLGAMLEVARLSNNAHLFAAALAYKVLGPPERGWRRSEANQRAASIFAGSPQPISDEALLDFSRQAAPYTGLLDRTLKDSVAFGRNPAKPVLLMRAESDRSSGFLVLDTAGCFPIAWLDDVLGIALLLHEINAAVVVVSQEASGPAVLHELDRSGVCFVTGALPSRGEQWKPILQGSSRLGWTNHAVASSETVLRAARTFPASLEEAADLWDRLGVQRVAVPRAKFPALELSLTLAASVALGFLSWQLWRDRGRTSPQLALERFHDLDARVHFTPDAVIVGLPRGRRHSELMAGGFLAAVPDVPWLEDRRVEFGWS
jgi:hypothetical protein